MALGADRPRVAVFSLGGTIAMTGDASGGVVPALSGEQLLAAVPGLDATGVRLSVHDFRRLPSASLSFDDLVELAAEIDRQCVNGIDGVVVTQGTDTIEETAFLLDLLHSGTAPVVVTGAMRNPTLAGADGPANLLGAVQTAASPAAKGLGCVVTFADEIHAARFVRKTHSVSVTAFTSPATGPIGHLVEGSVRLLTRPPAGLHIDSPRLPVSARVPVVAMALDDDGSLLQLLYGQVDGVVVAAMGAGHVPAACVEHLAKLADTVPVVLASRTRAGGTLRETYGFTGSERDLLGRGLIGAGLLDPYKARVLLRLLVGTGAGPRDIAAAFQRAGTEPGVC